MLHTLFEECLKEGVRFYHEFYTLELIMHEGACCGALAWDMVGGGFHLFHAKATLLATGGYARAIPHHQHAHICSGDGTSLALRKGLPVQDLEFLQFHPTGIYGPATSSPRGCAARGLSPQLP